MAPIFQTMCQHIFQAYSKQFKLHKTGWRVYIYLLSLDREISSNCLECTRYTMVHFPSICSNQLYDEKRFPLWHFLPSLLHGTQLRCVAGGVDFFFLRLSQFQSPLRRGSTSLDVVTVRRWAFDGWQVVRQYYRYVPSVWDVVLSSGVSIICKYMMIVSICISMKSFLLVLLHASLLLDNTICCLVSSSFVCRDELLMYWIHFWNDDDDDDDTGMPFAYIVLVPPTTKP